VLCRDAAILPNRVQKGSRKIEVGTTVRALLKVLRDTLLHAFGDRIIQIGPKLSDNRQTVVTPRHIASAAIPIRSASAGVAFKRVGGIGL
jgi:hypothetical protein